MNKKLGLVVMIALALCVVLAGCSETVYIQAGDTSYEVTGVRIEEEYAGQAPAQGYQLLLIQAKGAAADMDQMQDTFFGVNQERITVSDGNESVQCKSVTWAASGSGQTPDVTAVLVFEVPTGFAEQFTLSGDAFGSVSLTSSKSALDSLTGAFQGND